MHKKNVYVYALFALLMAGNMSLVFAQHSPELKQCELLIGTTETLVREVYRVDLLQGKQKLFFNNIPAEADISSLQVRDKRIRLKLLSYARPFRERSSAFTRMDSGDIAWSTGSPQVQDTALYNSVPGVFCTLLSPVRGERDLEVVYIVTGLTWSARYHLTARGDLRAGEGNSFPVDLSGVVIISNRTAHTFENAAISVSGSNNRLRLLQGNESGFLTLSESPLADLWFKHAVEDNPENVYVLPGKYTIPFCSEKAVPILSVTRIPAERFFELESSDFSILSKGRGIPLEEVIRFKNKRLNDGLGDPLPPGQVIVSRAGSLRYQVAVAQMPHARPGAMISISLGGNRGILAYRRNRGRMEVQAGVYREYHEISLVSSLDYPVDVVINEEPSTVLKWELVSADAVCTRDGRLLIMTGNVEPKSSRTFAFSIQVQQPLL